MECISDKNIKSIVIYPGSTKQIKIGRSKDKNDVVIADDYISREHSII